MISMRRGHEWRGAANNSPEVKTVGVESVSDFIAVRENYKREVLRLAENLDQSGKVVLIWRIMEHSVNDGFEFANALGVSKDAILQGFSRKRFQNKHPEFTESLVREADSLEKYVNNPSELRPIRESVGGYSEPSDANLRDTLDFVDKYYSDYIAKKKLKSIDLPQQSPIEEAVMSALTAIKYARIPHYYPDSVSKILAIHFGLPENTSVVEMYDKGLIAAAEASNIYVSGRVHGGFVKALLEKYKIDVSDPRFKKIYESGLYKQIDMVYDVKINTAIRLGKKELLRQLILRGYDEKEISFEQDAETGRFSVKYMGIDVSKRGEQQKDEPVYEDFVERRFDVDKIRNIHPFVIGVEVFYNVEEWKDGKNFIVDPKGNEGEKYDSISSMTDVNGELFYRAIKDGKSFIVDSKGNEGEKYDSISSLTNVNGELFYFAIKDDEYFIVGQIGRRRVHDYINSLININGKLFYCVDKDSKSYVEALNVGRGKEYDGIESLTNVNGELFYCAQLGDKYFIVDSKGNEGEKYDSISSLTDINGQLHYLARNKNEWFCVGPVEKKSLHNKHVRYLTDIGGQIYYRSFDGENHFVVGPGGKEGPKYEILDLLTDINGELYYRAHNGVGWFIVHPDGTKSVPYSHLIATIYRDNNFYLFERTDSEYVMHVHHIKFPNQDKQIVLTTEEQKILDEMNLISAEEDTDEIQRYLSNKFEKSKTLKEKLQEIIGQSRAVLKNLNDAIATEPELFVDSLAAESVSKPSMLARSVLMRTFPEIKAKMEQERMQKGWKGFSGMLGGLFGYENREMGDADADPSSYLSYTGDSENFGGDPTAEGKEVFITREHQNEMIMSNLMTKRVGSRWTETGLEVSPDLSDPVKEHTFEIPNADRVRGSIQLPKLVGARIIPDRIKGIDSNGVEYKIEATFDKAGNARVVLPENNKIEKIIYSQSKQEVPVIMPEISAADFKKFTNRVARENPELLSQDATLPMEIKSFIDSISDKNPKEKCVLIEEFVRTISYYDFQNGEVAGIKRQAKDLDERFDMMATRMEELKLSKPELASVGYKKYAGVCADFAELTIAMLRFAGIPSGLVTGFRPSSTSVKTSEAHAVAFAMYPKSDTENGIITADGTPGGVTESEIALLKNIQQPSLSQKEKIAREKMDQIRRENLDALSDVEDALQKNDMEKIKSLTNGQLENLVNRVLRYEVNSGHLIAVDTVLNAARYGGLKVPDKNDADNLTALGDFHNFISTEVSRIRSNVSKKVESPGEKFFETVSSFIDAYKRDKNGRDAFDIVERIIDLSESALTEIERKCAMVIVMYLKAKKMK